MATKDLYYRHSQKFSITGLLLLFAIGIPVAILVGGIYGLATHWMPLVFLSFLLTFGCGGGLGLMVAMLTGIAKIRNPLINLSAGLLIGSCAIYTAWVSWLYALSGYEILALAPEQMLGFMDMLASTGVWSIGRGEGLKPTGSLLQAIWIAEALALVGTCTYLSYSTVRTRAFCEPCQEWMQLALRLPILKAVGDPAALKEQLEQGKLEIYTSLALDDNESIGTTESEVYTCESCKKQYLLSVNAVILSKDSKGNDKRRVKSIVDRLKISTDNYYKIKNNWVV